MDAPGPHTGSYYTQYSIIYNHSAQWRGGAVSSLLETHNTTHQRQIYPVLPSTLVFSLFFFLVFRSIVLPIILLHFKEYHLLIQSFASFWCIQGFNESVKMVRAHYSLLNPLNIFLCLSHKALKTPILLLLSVLSDSFSEPQLPPSDRSCTLLLVRTPLR